MSSSEKKKETKLKLKKEIRRFRQEIESRERNSQTTSPSCIRNCYTLHFIILG